MKKFSNPFFHSCEKKGRSIGEGNETSVEWNVVEAGSRSLLGAITAGLFYVKHPLSRGAHTDEPLTRTGQKHSRFRRRKWVAHMHTTVERERERGRGAARRVVSGIEISGFGNSRCKRLYDRPPPPRTIGLNSAN